MKKIVLCGGGTAGHIYPALAVAEKLKGYEIHYFGGNGIEKEIIKSCPNITFHEIPTVKFAYSIQTVQINKIHKKRTCKNFAKHNFFQRWICFPARCHRWQKTVRPNHKSRKRPFFWACQPPDFAVILGL